MKNRFEKNNLSFSRMMKISKIYKVSYKQNMWNVDENVGNP